MSSSSAAASSSPDKVTSGILAFSSVGNKRIYGFIDPSSGRYSEAVTFTIPANAAANGTPFAALAASPDLTKFAVTPMVNGHNEAGWIDAGGQFTAVTQAPSPGPFGGTAPVYASVGFDGAGNFYYKQNSQGSMYTDVYKVAAGATGNAQKLTTAVPGNVDHGAALDSDGTLLFGCENLTGNWLNANTRVMAIAPGTRIAKISVTGREKDGCPITSAANELDLLPTTNTAMVHEPVANADGTEVAFFYDDPDRVNHNFPTVYIVGADGHSQPTLVNLSEPDAKKLVGATLLRWS